MKRLVLIISIIGVSLFAETTNTTAKFSRSCRVIYPDGHRGTALVYDAFLEVPPAFLDVAIPQSALNFVHGFDTNGIPVIEGLTLREFSLTVNEFDETALFGLSASEKLGDYKSRFWWTTEEDLVMWISYIEAFGYTIDDLLTIEEYKQRIDELMPTE